MLHPNQFTVMSRCGFFYHFTTQVENHRTARALLLCAVEGADSDGVMYPSAAKPATTAPPRGVVSLTATAVGRPLGPLSDNGSVPDIDAVTATGTIPCPVGGTWLQTPATPVKAVPAAALQVRCWRSHPPAWAPCVAVEVAGRLCCVLS